MNLIINNETKEEVNIEKYLEKVIREVLKLEDIDEKDVKFLFLLLMRKK